MLKEKLKEWLTRPVPSRSNGGTATDSVVLLTDIGLTRSENQDRVAYMKVNSNTSSPFAVIALSDGMGGMRDGAECAALTIAVFFETLVKLQHELPVRRLTKAAAQADLEVHQFSAGHGGATLSAVLITADFECVTLNVGDSRIYAEARQAPGILERLTVDDSLAEAVGGTNKDLLQYIGMGYGLRPHSSVIKKPITKLLLTSDGVHFLSDQTVNDILRNSYDLTQLANRLLTVVRWSGAPDNASLAIISPEKIRSSLIGTSSTAVELFDSFGELYLLPSFSSSPKYTENQPTADLILNEKNIATKPTTKRSARKDDKAQTPTPKIVKGAKPPRSRAKTKNTASSLDDLQIVIDMDSTSMESTDENSR